METVEILVKASARMYQRVSAQLILLGAFFCLFYFLLYFTLNSTFAQQAFDRSVNSLFRGQIGWNRIAWGPLPWELKVLEPVLADPSGKPVITARTLTVENFRFVDLVSGKIAADGIVIDTPRVLLRSRQHPERLDVFGNPMPVLNIVEMFWPPGAEVDEGQPSNVSLSFSKVDIRNGHLELALPQVRLVFEKINSRDIHFDLEDANGESTMNISAARVTSRRGRTEVWPEGNSDEPDEGMGWDLEGLMATQFHWQENAFGVAKFEARIENDQLRAQRISLDLSPPDLPHLRGDFQFQTTNIARQLRVVGVDGISGPLRVELDVDGELDAIDALAEIDGGPVDVFGYSIDAFVGTLVHDQQGRITIPRMEVDAFSGKAELEAEVDIDRERGWLHAWLNGMNPVALPTEMSQDLQTLLSGALTGTLSVSATNLFDEKRRMSAHTSLSLERKKRLLWGAASTVDLDSSVSLHNGTLTLEHVRVESGTNRFSSTGEVRLDGLTSNLTGRFITGDMSTITSSFNVPVRGQTKLQWDLKGSLREPVIDTLVEGRGVIYGRFPAIDGEGGVRYRAGRLELERLRMTTNQGIAGVHGTIGILEKKVPLNLEVNARKIPLASLPLDLPLTGRVSADLQLEGPATDLTVTGKGRIARACLKTPHGQKPLCYRRLDAKGSWSGAAIGIESLVVKDNVGTVLEASGEGDLTAQTFDSRVRLSRLPINIVNHFVDPPLPIGGEIDGTLDASGPFDAPEGRGQVSLRDAYFDIYSLGESNLRFSAQGNGITLQGSVFDGLPLKASIPTRENVGPAEARLLFSGLQLERRLPQLEGIPLQTSMSGTIELRFDIFAGQLEEITAEIPSFRGSYDFLPDARYMVAALSPINLRFADGALEVARSDLAVRLVDDVGVTSDVRSDLLSSVTASGRLSLPNALDFKVSGDVDLTLIRPFLRSIFIQSEGRTEIEGLIKGYTDDPRFSANLNLKSGSFVPRSSILGNSLELMEPVRFTLSPLLGPPPINRDGTAPVTGVFDIRLASDGGGENVLRLLRDEAPVTVDEFDMSFVEYTPNWLKLHAFAGGLNVSVPRVLRATVNAPDLEFELWEEPMTGRAPETRMRLGGDVKVLRGEYFANLTGVSDLNQGIRDNLKGQSQIQAVSIFERFPLLKRLKLDLSVFGDGDFYIRNQVTVLDLNLEIRMALQRISGFLVSQPGDQPDEQLRIDGQIDVLPDSTMTYARRDFDVTRGSLNFGGVNFLDADLEASRTFSIRTGQGSTGTSTSFDRGGSDVRLEEVVLQASMRVPTRDSPPEIDLNLTSNSGASKFQVAMLVLTGSFQDDLNGAASAQPATEVLLAPLLSLVERPLEDTLNLDLSLTPASTGSLIIDADKILSRRLRLYSRVLVGDDDDDTPQRFGLNYQINNVAFGEVTSEQTGSLVSTTGGLRLKLNLN